MTLLSASFGKYASAPLGWLFMACVIIIEIIIMSKILSYKHTSFSVVIATIISNIASGAVGAVTSSTINNGWMLVVWFPWVSSHEVDTDNPESLFNFIVYFAKTNNSKIP